MVKYQKLFLIVIIVSIISFISIPISIHYQRQPEIHYIVKESPPIKKIQNINDDSVLYQIKKLKIKYPKIALAQAKLESNNYKSFVFKHNKNLFGMTPANLRPTTSIHKSGQKYAVYQDYIGSVLDYAMFQSSFIKQINSEDDYYNYLRKYYASDRNYVKKLKFIVDTL